MVADLLLVCVCALQDKEERYLMLFPNVLVMLSASPRMSGFIYQVSLPAPNHTHTTTLTQTHTQTHTDRQTFNLTLASDTSTLL